MENEHVAFEALQGLRIDRVLVDGSIYFVTDKGTFRLWHEQECCEIVTLDDIVGDPQDLKGATVILAEEAQSTESNDGTRLLWTFYRLVTNQGDVTIRWCGDMNTHYSVEVSFARFTGVIPKTARESA